MVLIGCQFVAHKLIVLLLEAVSKFIFEKAQRDQGAGQMKEGPIHGQVPVVAHHQPAIIAQSGKGAFDLPTLAVSAQVASVVEGGCVPTLAVRTQQQHAPLQEPPAQRVAFVGPVGDDPQRAFLRTAPAAAGHRDRIERRFGQSHLGGRGAGQVASQRNTLAVDHHHPLRALAALGFADAVAPFLAGAKLPSRKLSCQSSRPRWSNSDRKARHNRSHTPCSSQARRRFQHTLGLTPKSRGRSCHRAPVLKIHRIPSSTTRWGFGGRPRRLPLRGILVLGRRGSIFFHWASVSNGLRMTIVWQYGQGGTSPKCYYSASCGTGFRNRFYNNGHALVIGSLVEVDDYGDSPGFKCYEDFVDIVDDFEAFIRFKPSPIDSIAVSLAKITWGWSARADEINDAWGLTRSNVSGPVFIEFLDGHEFPFWLEAYDP